MRKISSVPRDVIRKQYKVDWLQPADYNDKHIGKRSFVIGGGHSIKTIQAEGFDFRTKLKDEITIGVNKAYKVADLTYLLFGDYWFWKHWQHEVRKLDCVNIVPENILKGVIPDKTLVVRRSVDVSQMIPDGFDKPFSFVNNTGVAALRAAYVLGCDPIYLIGMDITYSDTGESHFHEDYVDRKRATSPARYKQFHQVFTKTLEAIKSNGRTVYSCSPSSPLNSMIDYVPITSLFV